MFGLWKYVEKGESCQVAATVDGGQLSWKVTQISAGIKLIVKHAIDPRTKELLFGDTGYGKIQSRNVCFPLHVHIAADNKQLYNEKLKDFFDRINLLEDKYASKHGLKFAHHAVMSSLQKTVRCGGQ